MAYKNKEDQAKASRDHYLKNAAKMKKRAAANRDVTRVRNKKFIAEYLDKHPCVDCGEKDPVVLDFDHVRGKKVKNVADAVNHGWSLKRIKDEIAKCEVRCANCHRRATHKRRTGI